MPPFAISPTSSPRDDHSKSCSKSSDAMKSHPLGPSRRSNSKLSLESCAKLPPAAEDGLDTRYPMTPPHKNRDMAKRFKYSSGSESLWSYRLRRRAPLCMWVLAFSAFLCIMCLHMNSSRQAVPMSNHVISQGGNTPQNLRRIEEKVQSAKNKPTITRQSLSPAEHGVENQIVHVIQTRFMQDQSNLLELGFARLALFEAFCLPSMLAQTNSNFLWIIRTDPHLHPTILDKLAQLLGSNPNYILLGSNHNPEGFGRDGSSFEHYIKASRDSETKSVVWSGNLKLVEEAYEKSTAGSILLETRLDSDDALHKDFVNTVQRQAGRYLAEKSTERSSNNLWRLWCIHSNMEWHPFNPFPDDPEIQSSIANNDGSLMKDEGYLVLYSDGNICVTPGLTFGYGAGASRQSIPGEHLRHDEIVSKIKRCSDESKKGKNHSEDTVVSCVSRLTTLLPGALRTRTTTSAGMNNVFTGNDSLDQNVGVKARKGNKQLVKQFFEQDKLWGGLKSLYLISREDAKDARWLIVDRMQEIAEDNLRGQCTPGHSCKNDTQALLKKVASY